MPEVEYVGGPFDGLKDEPEELFDILHTPDSGNGQRYYYHLVIRDGHYVYLLRELDTGT